MSRSVMKHQFVDCIPDQLEDNIVYVSIEFATAIHKCACGCGNEVVTPISPTDWQLTYDGDSISLHPSIGNWSFRCRSHYWIIRNEIMWSDTWSKRDVKKNRENDKRRKRFYYQDPFEKHPPCSADLVAEPAIDLTKPSIWKRVKTIFLGAA